MADMKIGTTAQTYANATLTFQVNPKTVNVPFDINDSWTQIPYGIGHILIGAGGVATRKIVLNGEVYGASKVSNFNGIAKQIYDNSIKRFWISSTRFYYVKGSSIRKTDQGGRTNFIDYVASLDTILPFTLNGTASTYTWTTTNANKTTLNDATGGSVGAFTNAGNAPAIVEWTIENAAGSAITKIEIGGTSDFDTSPHKIEWTGSLTSGNTLTISLFSYVSQGSRGTFKDLRWAYPTVSGTKSGNVRIFGESAPWVDAEGTDQAFSIELTGNDNTANVVGTWYPSYIG